MSIKGDFTDLSVVRKINRQKKENLKQHCDQTIAQGVVCINGDEMEFSVRKVFDNRISAILPVAFEKVIISDDFENDCFSNDDGSVYICFTALLSDVDASDTKRVKENVMNIILSNSEITQLAESVFLTNDTKEVFSSEIIVSKETEYDCYQMLCFFEMDSCMIMVSFQCTDYRFENWKDVIKQMAHSIQIL